MFKFIYNFREYNYTAPMNIFNASRFLFFHFIFYLNYLTKPVSQQICDSLALIKFSFCGLKWNRDIRTLRYKFKRSYRFVWIKFARYSWEVRIAFTTFHYKFVKLVHGISHNIFYFWFRVSSKSSNEAERRRNEIMFWKTLNARKGLGRKWYAFFSISI